MRLDVFYLPHPGQHRSGTISGIADKVLWLEVALSTRSIMVLALNLGRLMSSGWFYIHDDAGFGID
ncbi:hypothetical protein PS838_05167 [Pseudomonas fluorescens]|nr:hypothetical protein PS838_05167 [Pseudomonas fluorescens]